MTEDEAKKKWCPMYQVSAGITGNDDVNNRVIGSNCVASDCMAWRWDLKDYPRSQDGKISDTEGYCGLAK